VSLLLHVRDCWIMQQNTSISDRDEESRTVVDVGARQGKELASLAMHGREGTPLLLDRGGSVWWCSWLTHTERERGTCSCCVHAYGDGGDRGMFENIGDGMLTQASGGGSCACGCGKNREEGRLIPLFCS